MCKITESWLLDQAQSPSPWVVIPTSRLSNALDTSHKPLLHLRNTQASRMPSQATFSTHLPSTHTRLQRPLTRAVRHEHPPTPAISSMPQLQNGSNSPHSPWCLSPRIRPSGIRRSPRARNIRLFNLSMQCLKPRLCLLKLPLHPLHPLHPSSREPIPLHPLAAIPHSLTATDPATIARRRTMAHPLSTESIRSSRSSLVVAWASLRLRRDLACARIACQWAVEEVDVMGCRSEWIDCRSVAVDPISRPLSLVVTLVVIPVAEVAYRLQVP